MEEQVPQFCMCLVPTLFRNIGNADITSVYVKVPGWVGVMNDHLAGDEKRQILKVVILGD